MRTPRPSPTATHGLPPLAAGIGLRHAHYAQVARERPELGFVEVHSENFFCPDDAAAQVLRHMRGLYPVSLHGVGLALGSACGVDPSHLEQLAALVERIEPARVSDHACFARAPLGARGVAHANDLLPLAFTRAQLRVLESNVQQVQERLRRPILLENLSSYIEFRDCEMPEPEFFAELARSSGCGLLLDVNNLMVNARNRGAESPLHEVCDWLDALAHAGAGASVGEIHLAGHSLQHGLVIDDHGSAVSPQVWSAYEHALRLLGPVPTLVEWDTAIPELPVLLGEAAQARARLAEAVRAADEQEESRA